MDIEKVKLFGVHFLFDEFLRIQKERIKQKQFESYLFANLNAINKNLTLFIGGGAEIQMTWEEFIKPHEVDNRTADEMIEDVAQTCGLEVI